MSLAFTGRRILALFGPIAQRDQTALGVADRRTFWIAPSYQINKEFVRHGLGLCLGRVATGEQAEICPRPFEVSAMAHVRLPCTHRAFVLAGLTLLLACPSGHAQQFVLFDATFTFTKEDADNSKPSKSHYYVRGKVLNADRPTDWTKPVDYRNGTVHIRAEVIEKPAGGAPTTWTLCYIPNKGQKNGYGCTGTDVYREKGVYEKDVKMTSFWQNDNIVWEEGIKEMHLVMKDDSGGGGHAHKRTDPEKFFPTKMRITMIQVAKGSTYDPKLVPNLPKEK